jgi:hypothetical protein
MSSKTMSLCIIEPLETRIAPAVVFPTIIDAENLADQGNSSHFVTASVGTPVLLKTGDVLTTGSGARSGSYLMFVEKGQALVFTTDFNNNNRIDTNEITGIAASDGLRLISFVDIHGDIVTNLRDNTALSDSDNNSSNDDIGLKGDGRVLLNSRIEKIELRSLTTTDISDQNGDGLIDEFDVAQRLVLSSYSLFGSVFAGAGFGVQGDDTSGLIVDDTGRALLQTYFSSAINDFGPDYYDETVTPLKPRIGAIKVGTAASGEYFSFGIAKPLTNDIDGSGDLNGRDVLRNGNDTQGLLRTFTPNPGTVGSGIFYVSSNAPFDIGQLVAGNGGIGATGGNIENVTLNGDGSGGFIVQAGNGGGGMSGGNGGSILAFSDLGSNTSDVVIRSGSGGLASTGAGGNGGAVTFEGVNLLGAVTIDLGDGGTGFTSGGRGAGLEKAVIVTPDRLMDFVANIVGTTHDTPHDPATGRRIIVDPALPGVLGQNNSVDFDEDGFGDFVVTNIDPHQLYVQFTDGLGGARINPVTLRPDRIYLDAPINGEALTIGDFDGDGHLDIASGSSAAGNFSGIQVYLSKFEDTNGDGILTPTEDLDHDGVDDLLGFRTVRYSPIPEITDSTALRRSGHTISDIEAGDFNGDGFTDLAVTATFYTPLTLQPRQILFFMYPDVEDGKPTGQFFADFGTKGQSVPQVSPNPFIPFALVGGSTTVNIEVTALNVFAGHDVVVALSDTGDDREFLQVYDNSLPSLAGPTPLAGVPLGQVDTNRLLPNGNNQNISLADVKGKDFTLVDFDSDGAVDFSVLVEEPVGFLVTLKGDGAGGGARIDLPFLDPPGSNAGFFFGPPANNVGGANQNTQQLTIITVDADGDGLINDIAVLGNDRAPDTVVFELALGVPPADGVPPDPDPLVDRIVGTIDNPGAEITLILPFFAATSTTVWGFDAYHPFAGDTATVNYAAVDPETVDDGGVILFGFGDVGILVALLTEHFVGLRAGRGGDSLVGRAGDGGTLGSGVIDPNTLIGVLDIRTNLGTVDLFAGDGGNGFTSGGKGGSVIATVVDGIANTAAGSIFAATFTAGNGGIGVSGAGGAGGDLLGNSAVFGFGFTAGNGGRGIVGGRGGDIVGHDIQNFFDSQSIDQNLTAGAGGNGIKRGGDGGNIVNFHPSFDLLSLPESGTIIYLGGNGGTAVSGPGGRGGNVINTSPLEIDRNQLAGDIYLAGGKGGNGLVGGNGGTVNTFINKTDQTEIPAIVTFLGGDGGTGSKGRGGRGGDVLHVDTASTGFPNPFAIPATAFGFSRVVSGRGGDSAGNKGGNGGNVADIRITIQENALSIAAGAGGDGLFQGGNGGSVNGLAINLGNTSFAKAVIIAGQGGDANAYVANANDPVGLQTAIKAFGGRIGKGGNGGSIGGVSQLGSILSRIDLIAGNGGDTVNFGTSGDFTSKVGRGGSITNILSTGSLGNVDSVTPIKSYNNVLAGETMDDFVQKSLRNELAPGSLADDVGNVGLVVGAAGRIKQIFKGYDPSNNPVFPSVPAPSEGNAVNGSLKNIEARSIMAAVAGNVERIAAIQSVKDIRITALGVIGADKPGDARFIDKNGVPQLAPTLDGRLVDGAMATKNRPVDKKGQPIFLGLDVYVLT